MLSSQSNIVEIADSKIISEMFIGSDFPTSWLGSNIMRQWRLFLIKTNSSIKLSLFNLYPTIWLGSNKWEYELLEKNNFKILSFNSILIIFSQELFSIGANLSKWDLAYLITFKPRFGS